MNGMNEGDLRRRFAEMRGSDATNAPEFSASLNPLRAAHGAALGVRAFRPRPMRLLLAAAVLTLVAVGVSYGRRDGAQLQGNEMIAWRANSDALLAAGRPELFEMMPPLRSSVLDTVLP